MPVYLVDFEGHMEVEADNPDEAFSKASTLVMLAHNRLEFEITHVAEKEEDGTSETPVGSD